MAERSVTAPRAATYWPWTASLDTPLGPRRRRLAVNAALDQSVCLSRRGNRAMKVKRVWGATLLAGLAVAASGCVEHRTVYVPVYRAAPVGVQAPPGAVQGPTVAPAPTNVPPPGPAATTAVTQAPPPVRVEVVPVAPGPDYAWTPGYWDWQGGWVWMGGGWLIRPRPHAIWVGGHWGRHGRGWVWFGGHWR